MTGHAAPRVAAPAVRIDVPALRIDWTRCDGHGLCAALLPQAISRDEWGYPIVDQERLVEQSPSAVARTVACCPALALRREA